MSGREQTQQPPHILMFKMCCFRAGIGVPTDAVCVHVCGGGLCE